MILLLFDLEIFWEVNFDFINWSNSGDLEGNYCRKYYFDSSPGIHYRLSYEIAFMHRLHLDDLCISGFEILPPPIRLFLNRHCGWSSQRTSNQSIDACNASLHCDIPLWFNNTKAFKFKHLITSKYKF